ncbi:uncharacterized protein LACBIDRAFT_296465 [Laccaria bicolor S238N-H82]|uniref:non-specific serine/threonine protein kinase n=1 Tax=Laccaria bicolor (strain S238N-H82 / ATCC MYA-4686) TaxID=486041 RepID=B0D8V9_LACBS|nr:uncharacterized protein LACBIDRAFT_296465 [Laccaria bicolor S238N-H82]EDR08910.1 predicted protein [Laccaria bicolor S238N-H82]|eukprot:XP_001880223.1 predicted protein [Laccaria bicolor S238N-H82]
MLQQQSLHLPPQTFSAKDHVYYSTNDTSPISSPSLNQKRFQKDSLVVSRSLFSARPNSLSVSTNLSPSPSPSPSIPSATRSRSPYIFSGQASSPMPFYNPQNAVPVSPTYSRASSIAPSVDQGVLAPGDVVGEGISLQGELIRLVSIGSSPTLPNPDHREPATEFEVVRRLGTGSYAVVYLVQEVLFRPAPSEDGHMSTIGSMEFSDDGKFVRNPETVYGRNFAIKCLSKANLDKDALAAQMSEVMIHQSLHLHTGIVTLHRTLETPSFLLLLLEYVPGEDLFYFLEQARDHYDLDHPTTDSSVSSSRTPPTPSLLSNLHPSQLLSRSRLRLISSMFAQMCDAVAACHSQQVFHRDIKPENFIVTDGWVSQPSGRLERKVIVKLTDFGLSTSDVDSSDMDCGSAPYMSYECRNNVAPTYRPSAADVWSLGIVLINMLYHYNPWTDTAEGACSSFDAFRRDPINFFMTRFTGMTRPVAELLATRVFCILDNPQGDSQRITAHEFGLWAKNLPDLLGNHGVHRTLSSSSQGYPLSATMPFSHRPSSRQASISTTAGRTPALPTRSLSRAPSLGPTDEREEACELSTVIDQDDEGENGNHNIFDLEIEETTSRSTSNHKRRKRGARKGKGAPLSTSQDEALATLAVASQSLAREISKASKSSSHRSVSTKTSAASSRRTRVPFEPPSMYAMPTALLGPRNAPPSLASPVIPPPVTKKPSKWKLSFGKNSASALAASAGRVSPVEEVSLDLSNQPSATVSNVTNLLMGLNAPSPQPPVEPPLSKPDDSSLAWNRGRRGRGLPPANLPIRSPPAFAMSTSPPSTRDHMSDKRELSPLSSRSGRPSASSASSVVSGNWRSSMSTSSSAGTSTSAFTRYSNSSSRSISTTATSVSSASWRTSVKPSSTSSSSNISAFSNIPKNIKIMNGVPWELDQLPRGQFPNPVGDIFGSPPVRKQRTRKPKDQKLDTITERPPNFVAQKAPEPRRDASTSTTDLGGLSNGKDEGADGVKKVQKGQINALAKMLSALRR